MEKRLLDPGLLDPILFNEHHAVVLASRLRAFLNQQVAAIEGRLRHLVDAIATGKATESIFSELQKAEKAKKSLTTQIEDLDELSYTVSLDAKRIERSLHTRASDWNGLIRRHPIQARQMLRKILEGHVICTPFKDARGRGYEVSAAGSYAGLSRVPSAFNDGGGEGGIRTHGRVTPTAVFETARFGRSRTSPFVGCAEAPVGCVWRWLQRVRLGELTVGQRNFQLVFFPRRVSLP